MTSLTSYTDEELILMLRADDEAAFTELYNRYWERLYATAAHKINDLQTAEEIVHNIFISIWQRRHQLELEGTLNKYLAVALKYQVINHQSKKYRTQTSSAITGDLHIADASTQHHLSFNELVRELAKFTKELPENYQLVFRLSREAGFTRKQIAAYLNLSEKTVETYITRALKLLKAGLTNFLSLLILFL